MRVLMLAVMTAWSLIATADVKPASAEMTTDGRLDEPCWAAADWNGEFCELAGRQKGGEIIQTSFAIVADARAVYVGVRCREPALDAVRALPPNNLWNCDCVEIFLAPSGRSFSFYHFAVPYDLRNGTATRFLSEGGNITPDPYGPPWKMARQDGTDEWTVEIEIPLSSFYMTRNDEWSTTWLVNVSRTRRAGPSYQWTTWSPLRKAFTESDRYRSVRGFPMRAAADDVALTDVTGEIATRREGRLEGRLRMKAFALEAGDYALGCSSGTTERVTLKSGWNDVSVPCVYPGNGRYRTELTLTREATGARYMRTFPVLIDFEEIRVKLTKPQYRDNFYPGQDSSKIVGTVKVVGKGAVKLTLEGPGIPRVEAAPDTTGAFAFETPSFDFGTATLTVDYDGVTKRVPVRKLEKTGHQMSWIEDGCLVVDGKRTFRRDIYAWHYHGGTAFDERTAADMTRLGLTNLKLGGTFEPGRVIKGLEEREAKTDVVPCGDYFKKIDKMIERSKTQDFCHWYISDEPECRNVSQIYLRHIYEYVKERDPYHVILTSTRSGLTFIDCADWFETHPYIGPVNDESGNRHYARPLNEVGGFIDVFEPEKRPDKCIGALPQLFAYRYQSLENDYPTFEEYRCNVWAALLRGAKTLNPYAYHDMGDRAALYEGNIFVNASVARLEDLLLNGKRTTLLKTDEGECARWDLPDGDAMFALVNFTNQKKSFEVKGLDGSFRPFRSQRVLPVRSSTSTFNFVLNPFEVVVGTLKKRDEGLPTVEEAAAMIARKEYERTHRDNQLLEKYGMFPDISYKLIDGVRDMYAFGKRWIASKDFEIAFPDRPVRFSKARVYGANIKEVRVAVERDGVWAPVEVENRRPEKYCVEADTGRTVEVAKLRVTVVPADKNKNLELYELEVPKARNGDEVGQGVPSGCDPSVMSEAYWKIWNAAEQAKIDADIEANRKADGVFFVDAPAGTEVAVEQLDHDFRFGAHIFNFNQLGKPEWNDAYKASYGRGGLFNQATVAFYWANYEPTPGKLRAHGQYEDSEDYWNGLTAERAMLDPNWRRPAPGPVIDFLKAKGVAVHGHILVWGLAKPDWIYDWYCPENEKRAFDALGIPRHCQFFDTRKKLGVEGTVGFAREWTAAWSRVYRTTTEEEIERLAPVFTANMRRIFRKRVFDVAAMFGGVADSWDVVNESSRDWERYRRSRTGKGVWKSIYGLMPGDYPLWALLDAREAMATSARLAINDYDVGPTFLEQVRDLGREGAKIDIVGCQMHIMNTNDCMRLAQGATDVKWVGTPQVIEERLNTMAKTGKPLHVSEVTITSPGTDARSRDVQAILTRNIYRKWFSHKALMGITWWNTVDGGGVTGEPTVSGLFTRDLRKKPAYLALDELINHEWRTRCEAKVRSEGEGRTVISFRGVRGSYRLSWACTHCGRRHSREVWLTGEGVSETTPVVAPCRRPLCYEPAQNYTVDGKPVSGSDAGLSLEKLYPEAVVKGEAGSRWAEVSVEVTAPEAGDYTLLRINDYFGRLFVNGGDCGELNGPWGDVPSAFPVTLKKGMNRIVLKTRAGAGGQWHVGFFREKDSSLRFE